MVEVQKDPMVPPRFKVNRTLPPRPPSPTVPVMHSPPRAITEQERAEWKIPPCVSNWRNRQGHIIPLHMRQVANIPEGTVVNDRFAKLSESLFVCERAARAALEERRCLERKVAHKNREAQEEKLRQLARQARQDRQLWHAGLKDAQPDSSMMDDAQGQMQSFISSFLSSALPLPLPLTPSTATEPPLAPSTLPSTLPTTLPSTTFLPSSADAPLFPLTIPAASEEIQLREQQLPVRRMNRKRNGDQQDQRKRISLKPDNDDSDNDEAVCLNSDVQVTASDRMDEGEDNVNDINLN